jgi:hypothetical protein
MRQPNSGARGLQTLSEATIRGETIKLGEPALGVQRRLAPDSLLDPNRSQTYGYIATARYVDAGATYIVKFGPPRHGIGAYVVTSISRAGQNPQ